MSQILDIASGEISLVLRGHVGFTSTIQYSLDGRYLITASVDGTVRVWDAESGAELLVYHFPSQSRFNMACFTPDSQRVLALDGDGYYYLLAFQNFDELVDVVRERVTRDWKPEERRRYLR